ncbi:MAG: mechanosensitive ion channel domain-containing protein [Thermoanaerobaculales bacterium]|jgi:small conductance mechanosensitive channel|nr:mechanosensitive ion channel domain-containing protein [Thermoanaerobaculales bacterium]
MRRAELPAAVVSIILVCCAGVPALGQDVPDAALTAEERLEAEAQKLRTAIDEHWNDLLALDDQLEAAGGDNTRALRERGRVLLAEFQDDLDSLTTNIVAREEVGLDAADDRGRVTELMQQSAAYIQSAAEQFLQRSEELRVDIEDAAAEDERDLTKEIEYADQWYGVTLGLLAGQVAAMEEFGVGAEESKTFLVDHLADRAELLAGRVLLARDEVDRIGRLAAVDPANTEIVSELDRADNELDVLIGQLQDTSRLMEELDMDASEYEQLIFEVTGEITTDLLNRDVLGGLVTSWLRAAGDWVRVHGPGAIFKLFVFVAILVAFRVLAKLARSVAQRSMKASKLEISQLLERTTLSLIGSVVMIFGLLVALSQVGFQVAPLLAGLGVAGFIVGFALQDTLGNFASGVMILLYRPYDVGDLVEAAGVCGTVKDMSLVSTTILTLDNQTLIIPNSKIWGDVIKNITAQTQRRVDLVFGIGYSDDIEHAERILNEIVAADDRVLSDPPPNIRLHNLGESSVDFIVRPWVATGDYWDVYWDITRKVKMRFDAEGISIPFPQRDVHVIQESEGEG